MSNFTNTKIKDTYQRVLQIDNGEIQDGLGLPVDARIQSLESDLGFTGDLDGTATLAIGLTSGDKTIQGNLDVIGKITAIEIYAQYESASIIYSSGSTKFGDTFDDTHQFTGSVSITGSSFSYNGYNVITSNDTSSIVVDSASYATFAATASYLLGGVSSASYALTASYIQLSGVDGFTVYSSSISSRVTNLENFSSSLDATFATDAQLNAATASLSSSIASLSSSYLSTSASFSSGINANTNSISALSSSFISFSGSYNTGSFTGSFTGNLTGTSSYAVSASHALNADNAISASYALTASYVNPLNQDVLISGSLKLNPTHDPDPSGLDLDSTVLFQSSSNTSLGYDLYIRQNGNLIKWKWVEGVVTTGLLFGGVVTYSGSTVFVSSGSGIIVDHNATTTQEISPIITYVNWSNISQSISNISTQQVTYLYIDQNGDLQQQSTRFTNDQYHDYIPLGSVGHFDYTQVSAFGGQVQTAYDQVSQISTFVDVFGPLKISGYGLTGQAGSLRLSVGSGQSFIHGGFYENNPELPSTITTNAQATASIAYVYRSGSGAAFDTNGGNLYTSLRPGFYDPGTGVTGSVSNNDWTIQRAYSDPKTGVLYIYYGQNIYPDYNTALADLSSDSFTEGDTFDFTIFVGFLILKSNTTNITNTGDNKIIPAGLFRGSGQGGGGGSAVSNLDDLSDVSITGPIDGEALVYNAGIWGNGTPTSSSYSVTSSLALSAVTASFAQTASLAPNYVLTSVTSSMLAPYVLTSQTSSMSVASASVATSASYALTASFALNGGGGSSFPFTGSAIISGSLAVTGSTNIQGALGISRALIERAEITVSASGVYTIYSAPTSSYRGIFADYTLVSTSPSGNARAGNIMSILSGSQVRYTETRTSDIGSTAGTTVQVNLSGGNLNLELNVATVTTTWNLVSLVRTI